MNIKYYAIIDFICFKTFWSPDTFYGYMQKFTKKWFIICEQNDVF